jgi:hypothetical protein
MKECELRAALVALTALLGLVMPAVTTAQSSPPAADRSPYTRDAIMADVAGIVDPMRAVGFRKCWQEPQGSFGNPVSSR